MKPNRCRIAGALCAAFLAAAAAVPLQAQDDWDYRVRLDVGYRWKVNFDGSDELYRSHIDLGEGPKLFAGDLFLTRPTGQAGLFDHLELRMNGWGGEPYNTASFVMGKAEAYQLRFTYFNDRYFNAIPSYSNPFFESGGDQTQLRYDTERKNLRLDLDILPGRTVSPFFSYHRFSHRGDLRNPLAADGDEFVVDTRLDTSSDEFSGGVLISFEQVALRIEQGLRSWRDESVSSGSAQDGNSDRPLLGRDIFLDGYRGNRNFSSTTAFSRAAVTWRPLATLQLAGNVYYSMADLDGLFTETQQGNFFAFSPVAAFYEGGSFRSSPEAKSPTINVTARAQWEPVERFVLSEHFTTRRFHTSGFRGLNARLTDADEIIGSGPTDQLELAAQASTFFAVNEDRQELIGQFFVTPELQLRAGHRWTRRRLEQHATRFSFSSNSLVVGLAYQFNHRNEISAEYELGRSDDATIQRTDPRDFDRVRILGRWSPSESLQIRGNASLFNHANDEPDIDLFSRSDHLSILVDYAPGGRIGAAAEYTRSRLRTGVIYLVPQVLQPDRFRYDEKGDFGSAHLNFGLPRSVRLSLGYSVWGNVGSFPYNFHQPWAELEVPLGEQLSAYGRWNFYGYNEKLAHLPQDYRTHLAVFGVRVAFDKPQP